MPSSKHGIDHRERDANLYRRYVKSTEEALRSLLALLPDQCHADFLEMNSVMSPEEFAKSLEAIANDLARRQQLEKALHSPRRRSLLQPGTFQA